MSFLLIVHELLLSICIPGNCDKWINIVHLGILFVRKGKSGHFFWHVCFHSDNLNQLLSVRREFISKGLGHTDCPGRVPVFNHRDKCLPFRLNPVRKLDLDMTLHVGSNQVILRIKEIQSINQFVDFVQERSLLKESTLGSA